MVKKTIYLTLFVLIPYFSQSFAANKVFEYNFENWGGSIADTPGYPFGSTYSEYCDEHAAHTEVIQSYKGATAHNGNYFLLFNHAGTLDPPVAGITGGGPYARMNIGHDNYGSSPNCGSDNFDINSITTGEVFLRFWSFTSDWDAVKTNPNAKLKFVRFYEAEDVDVIWYVYQNVADNKEPQFGLDGVGSAYYTGTISNFADGNWHKHSIYVNYNTGQAAMWFDVESESLQNATLYHDYGPGGIEGGPVPNPLVLIGNWSANDPTENIYHGLDDIEVWDGLPSNECVDIPSGPPGDVTNVTAGYQLSGNSVAINASWTNPADADFKGTMVRYNVSATENYPQNHTEGTLGSDMGNQETQCTFNITSPGHYWISYFTYDNCGNYSQTAHASLEIPADIFPDSAPAITITQPVTGDSYIASANELNIGGTASDDNGVVGVAWQNDRGGSGSASGTSNWSVASIPLADGVNVITVTVTDSKSQSSTDVITVNFSPGVLLTWDAEEQTGQNGWSDSTAVWCVRVPVSGSSVMHSGNQVKIGFKGRNSGDYNIKKVSIAERDTGGAVGAVLDSTWTQVTFDGYPVDSWATKEATVVAGDEKVSDPVDFDIQTGKEYYVTFMLVGPSAYLSPSSEHSELYFSGSDHSGELDWVGFATKYSRLHALSKIYISSCGSIDTVTGVAKSSSTP